MLIFSFGLYYSIFIDVTYFYLNSYMFEIVYFVLQLLKNINKLKYTKYPSFFCSTDWIKLKLDSYKLNPICPKERAYLPSISAYPLSKL